MSVLETKGGAGLAGRHPRSHPRSFKVKYRRGDTVAAWVLLAPALVLFAIFIIVPTLSGIGLSFFSWHFLDTPTFNGVKNYQQMIADPVVWQSLGITFEFVILGVIPTILIGFMLAVLVNAKLPGISVLRILYFVPVVLSIAVSGVLWNFIYDPRQGPIASAARAFGIEIPNVLQSSTLAVPALVVMMVWLSMPIVIILYLAALQRVSPDIYAAAALDGAGPWRTLWSITWPNVRSTTLVVAVLQVIGFSGGSLDVAKVMTNGDPLGATQSLAFYSYKQAFTNIDAGYSSTLSVLQLVIIVAIVVGAQLIIRRVSR